MCNAIYVAAVLAALIAGLTYLRIKEGKSPNAEMLADLLNDDPARTCSGKDAPSPSAGLDAAHFPC